MTLVPSEMYGPPPVCKWIFARLHTCAEQMKKDNSHIGRLKYREDIVDGLDKAPASFLGMLQGKNFGKMLVRITT
jgi:NADPH-dependent curcumin reductase CurA